MLKRLLGPVLLGSGLCALSMPEVGCVGNIGDKGASSSEPAPQVTEDALMAAVSGVRRLTTDEYDNVLEDLLGDDTRSSALLLPTDVKDPFDNDYTTQKVSQALIESAEALATAASARLLSDPSKRDVVVGCKPTGPDDEDCLRHFIATFGRKALRRPLEPEEIDRYALTRDLAVEGADFYVGVDAVLRAFLQHPEFLYRVEVGTPVAGEAGLYRLTSAEVATRLSFFLWGSTPDAWLLDLADADRLQTVEQIRSAALQALGDPRARRRVGRFHALWLGYETLPFDPMMATAMQTETEALLERVIFDEQLPYSEVFLSKETFVSDELAQHYGLTPGGSSKPGWTDYGDSGRRGILSHGTFLSNGAKFGDTSPTVRGLIVRMKLLCQEIGNPPAGVDVDKPLEATETAVCKIEKQAAHAQGGCAGCHDLMDPIGFGLENYDAQGVYRTHDVGLPECTIEGAGEVAGIGTFRGPAELAELLTGNDQFNRCVATQLYRFAVGRTEMDDVDEKFIDALMERAGSTDYRFDDLILEYITHDGFRYRREGGAK